MLLQEALQGRGGPVPVSELVRLAQERGLTPRSLRCGKEFLGLRSIKANVHRGYWSWDFSE